MDKIKNILNVIESGMNFRVYDENSVSDPWVFIEFSGNDLIVENPFGEIETKPEEFINSWSWFEVNYTDFTILFLNTNLNKWTVFSNSDKTHYKFFEDLEDAKEYCLNYKK